MKMPIIKPLPIKTKNQSAYIQISRWMTSIRKWQLVEDWHYTDAGRAYVIPKGFIFDGASIPRLLWFLLSPTGLLLIPGLIHDFGYRYDYLWEIDENSETGYKKAHQGKGQQHWDDMFYRIGQEVNGMSAVNFLAWLALATFGCLAWKGHRKNEYDDIYPGIIK